MSGGASTCGGCGSPTEVDANFCSQCGAGRGVTGIIGGATDERRTVTVLFADVTGYTALAEQLDPEAAMRLLRRLLGRLATEVRRHGGHVDKFMGDNVMGLFGAPITHEDDPVRAVRAGLGMQRAIGQLNQELEVPDDRRLRLRVGINTGEVLAGRIGANYTVMGDAVNVASRLESAAVPGSVVVGATTRAASRSAIEFEELGGLELKGKTHPVPAWRAVGTRHGSARTGPRVGLVGRTHELELLEQRLADTVDERRAGAVALVGEPGVGKTRIVEELAQRFERGHASHHTTLWRGAALPYGTRAAYPALAEVFRGALQLGDGGEAERLQVEIQDRVLDLIGQAEGADTAIRATCALLGVGDLAWDRDNPDSQRDMLSEGLRVVLEALAQQGPVVVVLEDLHWATRALVDLVAHLVDVVNGPVFFLITARPEFHEIAPELAAGGGALESWTIGPLPPAAIAELVRALGPPAEESDELAEVVVDRAGGNPLFAEELVRHLVDKAGGAAPVPATLHGLLVARLDELGPAGRRVVQLGSVLGTRFSPKTLELLLARDGDRHGDRVLAEKLPEITSLGILVERDDELAFHHALVRDTAYSMVPKADRSRLHGHVGDVLSDVGGSGQTVAVRAEHYLQAALLAAEAQLPGHEVRAMRARARHHLELAADQAASVGTHMDAAGHLEVALALEPESQERLEVTDRLGDALMRSGDVMRAIETWTAAQESMSPADVRLQGRLDRKLGRAYVRAGKRQQAIEHLEAGISRLLEVDPGHDLIELYEAAAELYMAAGENMLAVYASEHALLLAEQLRLPAAASRAHLVFGVVNARRGDVSAARTNLDTAWELAQGADDAVRVAVLQAQGHHHLRHEGAPSTARDRFLAGQAIAVECGDVPLQADLTADLAELALLGGAWAEVEHRLEEFDRLQSTAGLLGREPVSARYRAWLRWVRGDVTGALELFDRAHALAATTRARPAAVGASIGAATVERFRGEWRQALDHLAQARRHCEGSSQWVWLLEAAGMEVAIRSRHVPATATAAADELTELVAQVSTPAAGVVHDEALGVLEADTDRLARAEVGWEALGRPWDAARCALEHASLVKRPRARRRALESVANRLDALAVQPVADLARTLAAGGGE